MLLEDVPDIENSDIKLFIPQYIPAPGNPTEGEKTIYKLTANTFVSQVRYNALTVTWSLLKRDFLTRKTR